MSQNPVDYWAAQERSVRIPSEKPRYVLEWETNRERWKNTEDEWRQPGTLEQLFEEHVHTGLPTDLKIQKERLIVTEYFVAMMKRCWMAWVQDGNPNAPEEIDREAWLDYSPEKLEAERQKILLIGRTVMKHMEENNLPIWREIDEPEIYSPSKGTYLEHGETED